MVAAPGRAGCIPRASASARRIPGEDKDESYPILRARRQGVVDELWCWCTRSRTRWSPRAARNGEVYLLLGRSWTAPGPGVPCSRRSALQTTTARHLALEQLRFSMLAASRRHRSASGRIPWTTPRRTRSLRRLRLRRAQQSKAAALARDGERWRLPPFFAGPSQSSPPPNRHHITSRYSSLRYRPSFVVRASTTSAGATRPCTPSAQRCLRGRTKSYVPPSLSPCLFSG
jgi:hypothetical protein